MVYFCVDSLALCRTKCQTTQLLRRPCLHVLLRRTKYFRILTNGGKTFLSVYNYFPFFCKNILHRAWKYGISCRPAGGALLFLYTMYALRCSEFCIAYEQSLDYSLLECILVLDGLYVMFPIQTSFDHMQTI